MDNWCKNDFENKKGNKEMTAMSREKSTFIKTNGCLNEFQWHFSPQTTSMLYWFTKMLQELQDVFSFL